MSKSASELAKQFLGNPEPGLDVLRIHQFSDDVEELDDAEIERLYSEFLTELERVTAELTAEFGAPAGLKARPAGRYRPHFPTSPLFAQLPDELFDAGAIPVGGAFAFGVWKVGSRQLFAAIAHEDRELPILLVLGVT